MFSRIDTCAGASSKGLLSWYVLIAAGLALTKPALGQLSAGGEYEYYAGLRLRHQADALGIRNRVRLRGRYSRDRIMAYSEVRISHGISDTQKGGGQGPVRLRLLEAFVDLYFNQLDLRIGHQLVVWGQLDGTFITDVVSPLDLSEFLTQDFADIRLAVPAIKASYFVGQWSVTGLIVLAPVKSLIPSSQSPWFVVPKQAAGLDVRLGDDNLPDPKLEEIEPGLKVSYNGIQTSLDFIYWFGRNRTPVFGKSLSTDAGGGIRLVLRPEYFRRHVVGSRFSSTIIPSLVVEAELAYESKFKVDVNPSSLSVETSRMSKAPEFLINQGRVAGGLALSRTYRQTLIRGQLLGSLLTRYDQLAAQDRFHGAVTVLVRSAWSNETFGGSVFVYYNPGADYWLNPVLEYRGGSGLNFFVGAQIFGGDTQAGRLTTDAFGLFDENDFAYVRLTIAF